MIKVIYLFLYNTELYKEMKVCSLPHSTLIIIIIYKYIHNLGLLGLYLGGTKQNATFYTAWEHLNKSIFPHEKNKRKLHFRQTHTYITTNRSDWCLGSGDVRLSGIIPVPHVFSGASQRGNNRQHNTTPDSVHAGLLQTKNTLKRRR